MLSPADARANCGTEVVQSEESAERLSKVVDAGDALTV